jgi:hypothetical protein
MEPHATIMVSEQEGIAANLALEFAIPTVAKTSEVLGFGRCREGGGYLTTHGVRLRSAADRSRGVRDELEHRSLNAVCGVIGIDRNWSGARQARIAAGLVDNDPDGRAVGFVENAMLQSVLAFLGEASVRDIELAERGVVRNRVWVVHDGQARKRARSSSVAFCDPVCGVAMKTTVAIRSSSAAAAGRLPFCWLRSIRICLVIRPPKLWPIKVHRMVRNTGLGKTAFEHIDRPVLERHSRSQPVRGRRRVAQRVDGRPRSRPITEKCNCAHRSCTRGLCLIGDQPTKQPKRQVQP